MEFKLNQGDLMSTRTAFSVELNSQKERRHLQALEFRQRDECQNLGRISYQRREPNPLFRHRIHHVRPTEWSSRSHSEVWSSQRHGINFPHSHSRCSKDGGRRTHRSKTLTRKDAGKRICRRE